MVHKYEQTYQCPNTGNLSNKRAVGCRSVTPLAYPLSFCYHWTHTHTYKHTYTQTHTRTSTHTHVQAHTHTYKYTYTQTDTHTYKHIFTQTHAHTPANSSVHNDNSRDSQRGKPFTKAHHKASPPQPQSR